MRAVGFVAALAALTVGSGIAAAGPPVPYRPAATALPRGVPLSTTQPRRPVASAVPIKADVYRTVFLDDFAGTTIDRTRWGVIGPSFWVNNEQQAYIDSPDTIFVRQRVAGATGGVLVLKPLYRPGADTNTARRADFVSGRIETAGKFDFRYGRVAARIRMSDARGFWPAFWLLGYGDWPASGEIDTMEYVGEKGWTSSALHGPGYSGNTPLAARFTFPAGEDVTGWHVYSVAWSDQQITFSVDERPFYTLKRADVERYGPWKFDNRKYLILNAALGGEYPFGVNQTRTPYYGVPQATVDKVKAGQVEFEVDWVQVQRRL